jgi:hypothetical protein
VPGLEDESAGATLTRAALVCCRDWKDAMDGSAFDRLVRHVSEDASRRGLLKSAFAATVAGLGVASVLGTEDAEAKKDSCKKKCDKFKGKKKRNCKKRCDDKCLEQGAFCNNDGQCCSDDRLICEIPFGAGNSDKKCCGGQGAICSTDAQCCIGSAGVRAFKCSGGTCVPNPGP